MAIMVLLLITLPDDGNGDTFFGQVQFRVVHQPQRNDESLWSTIHET